MQVSLVHLSKRSSNQLNSKDYRKVEEPVLDGPL